MKKDSLLKMKDLPATEEMLAVARRMCRSRSVRAGTLPIDADTAVLYEAR